MSTLVKKVYGVGVGVGDEKLITLKALEVLKKVDKIFIPISKKGKRSIAYEIIKNHIDEKDVEELLFPMIKDKEKLKKYWETAVNKVINEKGEVAVITIGDPTLYSTFSYLWKILKEKNIDVEIVNGISSIFASASALGIPLVEGDEKLCILPQGKDIEKYINEFDTIIIMKTKNLKEKLEKIKDKDNYMIGLVKKATFKDEKTAFGRFEEINFDEFSDYLSLAIIKRIK
ncbi:precorrin-2 C20-methyltransferase [Methanocaldococcus vulcanius M7]|uniref:Precorrin-2 C20-methyltransferase n=1 Tax=Methanocaldococcus vulcanius (strain ATCC 700851 / DSM 12094 / M7) TaxID=579137 RepID=C9REB1_METVM|nr:precorrin-2 C20-methyltransferase [Methanocaldococcus vulcanius M7]